MMHYKISIHIPFYIDDNYKDRFLVLKKVCKNYLQLSKHARIFIHTNKFLKKTQKKLNLFNIIYKMNILINLLGNAEN